MEKKGSRSLQPSSKGLSSDSKKSQDGTSGKLWPRSGRRREPTGGSLATKNESSRKPTFQRGGKSFDVKRPRPRSTFNTDSLTSRTETTRIEEDFEAELGSVFQPGSKKQSLNHLLNFVYVNPTREGSYRSERGYNRTIPSKKHKFNKEHFVQANCQFVVNTSGDYKQYMNNPDALVDWNLIEQVNVQVSDCPSCPICLYPPVAAKITKCGHIYCWSCILHYLSLSDKAWGKCPICYESVCTSDLKSVVSRQYKTFNVDDVITFKLMKRPKGSLVTYSASSTIPEEEIFNLSDMQNIDVYSKLLIAQQSEILSIIDRENEELTMQQFENGDCPENCFIEEALSLVNNRRDKLLKQSAPNVLPREQDSNVKEVFDTLKLRDSLCSTSQDIDNLHISSTNPQSKFYYFYQASDGQHIYLHAINAKMLEHTYGSLEHGPNTISGKILEKEGGSMTEELRKRLRYLQHLPVTCQFEVAEIQLHQPVVSKDTLLYFNEQLDVRKKRRQRRAKQEKRREKKIATEENRLLGIFPTPNIHLESQSQFPLFDGRTRIDNEDTPGSEETLSVVFGSPLYSSSSEQEHVGPSFAKMLASSKKAEPAKWPALKSSIPPMKLINVTGQKIQSASFKSLRNKSDSEPETEELELQPPTTSLGDAIGEALQKAEEGDLLQDSGKTPIGKKKKIKNRQKVLYTTNVVYTRNN